MDRCVMPEMLDELPPDDPRAARSRNDLARVNTWMGNGRMMARALCAASRGSRARRLVELGAGDGRFLLRVARRLSRDWEGTNAVLLDQQPVVSRETQRGFESLGWRTDTVKRDVFDWLDAEAISSCDAMVANLFLHHFSEAQLVALLCTAARRAKVFIALEPQRSAWSLVFSRMLWILGCNQITRHDAPVSVRAGFVGRELTALWPAGGGWSLAEKRAGWFSHLFVAQGRE